MRTFAALYTHQKLKKVKAWQEGTARYNSESNDLVLFDSSNQRISSYRLRAKDSIELSSEYDIGRFLLTLEAEQGQSPDTSGATESADTACATAGALSGRGMLKRAKKLPSLIKPMKVKAVVAVPESNERPAKNQPNSSAAPQPKCDILEYAVLHTTQKVKKIKAWAEGTLTFSPAEQRIVLRDEDGSTLTSTRLPKSRVVEVGGELDLGIYLIQIESVKGEANSSVLSSAPSGLQLQGALKRRHEALVGDAAGAPAKTPHLGIMKSGLHRIKLQKMPSELASTEPSTAVAAPASTTVERPALLASPSSLLPKPALARAGSSSGALSRMVSAAPSSAKTMARAQFVPPASQTPSYLHFPRRGELLQH
ncbi:hypothetical protein GGH95_005132, partial [Coemansia sp. RSA 1836]